MAKMIIEENEKLIGQEVAEKAKDKIEKVILLSNTSGAVEYNSS